MCNVDCSPCHAFYFLRPRQAPSSAQITICASTRIKSRVETHIKSDQSTDVSADCECGRVNSLEISFIDSQYACGKYVPLLHTNIIFCCCCRHTKTMQVVRKVADMKICTATYIRVFARVTNKDRKHILFFLWWDVRTNRYGMAFLANNFSFSCVALSTSMFTYQLIPR